MHHMVVIGGGLAGARAAQELRTAGYGGDVTLISEEPDRPYDHVPLSKEYLHGGQGYHRLFIHDDDFYTDNRINLRLNSPVASLDPAARTIRLASGEELAYSAVLLATGAVARPLSIPGASPPDQLEGVHYLRTLADARALREQLHARRRLVVIGAGFLGCEIAASAASLGTHVTLISRASMPLLSALGSQMAAVYRELHIENGIRLVASAQARELRGNGRVATVVLTTGHEVSADIVAIAVGDEPRTDLAETAGLTVDDGVATDASLRTSAPGVYAAGDVASVWEEATGSHVRRAHFVTALKQGRIAARSMLGKEVRYDAVPFFFTDQFGVWMEYTGRADTTVEPVVHGNMAARRFVAFWLHDGHLTAAMNVGLRGVPDAVTPLIKNVEPVDEQMLRRIVQEAPAA